MRIKPNVEFFVYIIESPSPKDFYEDRSEGSLIEKAVSLNSIPAALKIVVSKERFDEALKIGIYEEMVKHNSLFPIIHLSAHGSKEGIQLTDGSVIVWEELKDYFKPINKAFNNVLLLCMSSCEGYNACRMSMHKTDTEYPFWAVVGNYTEPLWSETAVAYATFYHNIALGKTFKDAIEAMKVASGNKSFDFITAEGARKIFLDLIKEQNLEKIQSNLEENIEKETPGKTEEIKSKDNL